jgi:hypothetical protein
MSICDKCFQRIGHDICADCARAERLHPATVAFLKATKRCLDSDGRFGFTAEMVAWMAVGCPDLPEEV